MDTILIVAIVSWVVSGITIAYPDQVKAIRNWIIDKIKGVFSRQ